VRKSGESIADGVLFGWLFGCFADGPESENRRVIARGFPQCFHVLGHQLVFLVGEIVADMLGLGWRM
jgi:hypothetical protein